MDQKLMRQHFAHSLSFAPQHQWERLSHHLEAVGRLAGSFAGAFGFSTAGEAAGRLHDIGKCSREFAAYISQDNESTGLMRGPDHSTAGAREAKILYSGHIGSVLSFAIAGHHAGLANGVDLAGRLSPSNKIPDYEGWRAETGALPPPETLKGTKLRSQNAHKGFAENFLTRMLFSCLVDADFLATEAFYAGAKGEKVERGGFLPLTELKLRLDAHLLQKQSMAPASAVNRLRAEVLEHATAKAALPPGLFTLTVPTGGGKTLTSLSFALNHAVQNGRRRVIYVIPFTSIVDQTASVFREALRTDNDILEHHSSFDWDATAAKAAIKSHDDEGPSGLEKLKRAAENWDAPVVVTTAVQFFESLFAARTSRCRKLHNLAGSVIILDEAQTLPLALLKPCIAAIEELARNYGASVVLCTATQPALRTQDGFKYGLDIPDDRELAPEPDRLYGELKRVNVERFTDAVPDAQIVDRCAAADQMLCIVNSRAHARAIFESIRNLEGATHLTTLMCPRHRRTVLGAIRDRLKARLPVRLVSTSLIEAGVDIDFPEVWRAAAGLESIAQAAGRCNREGALALGRVVVFEPAEAKPPKVMIPAWEAARAILRRHADPLTRAAIREYFDELYWNKGPDAFDRAQLDGETYPILARIAERWRDFTFPFADIARAFRMIEETMVSVIVPWSSGPDDDDAKRLLAKIVASERPSRGDLRRLQLYSVPIPRAAQQEWLRLGALKPAHPTLGSDLLVFSDLSHYDPQIGLKLTDLHVRSSEQNIIS
jgi:CRISPR-associated endonuclease/helicase Cas3